MQHLPEASIQILFLKIYFISLLPAIHNEIGGMEMDCIYIAP